MLWRTLALLVCVLAWPAVGRAWTDAHVRDAQVQLKAHLRERRVEVMLDLGVEVRGGWLERLDLPDFEEGLVLAPNEPALAVLASGERVPAGVVIKPSVISLRFQRRDGLRRGLHRVQLRYSSRLAVREAPASGMTRISWTMPGWEAGLSQAAIELSVDVPGARPISDVDVAQEVTTQVDTDGARVRFTRVLVPRASAWTVALEVPQMPAAHEVSPALERVDTSVVPGQRRYATGVGLALAHFLLLMLRRRVQRARGDWSCATRPRFGLRRPGGALPLSVLAALGALLWVHALPLALSCWAALSWWGLAPAPSALRALPMGRFEPLTASELRRLRRGWLRELIGLPGADIASVLGALGALAVVLLVALDARALDLSADPWGLGALSTLSGSVLSSRLWHARSLAEQARILTRAACRARVVACTLSLVSYVARGRGEQPRLRLGPAARYPGLLRLEVLVDSRREARPLWLSASVEAGSAAERWLLELWPHIRRETSASGRRVALLCPIDEVGPAVETLLEHFSRQSQRVICPTASSAQAA